MKKKTLFALLLAAVMLLSGCSLVLKDSAVDAKQTIIDVNGEQVDKQTFLNAYNYTLTMQQYYAQMLQQFGGDGTVDEASILQSTLDNYISSLVLSQKAKELGFDQFTDAELAELQAQAQEEYDTQLESIRTTYFADSELEGDALTAEVTAYAEANGYTLDYQLDTAKSNKISERLKASVTDTVTITDDDLQAALDKEVASEKETFASTPAAYGTRVNAGTTVYYTPAGYRTIRVISVDKPTEEGASSDEAKQQIDALSGPQSKRYMHNYEMPPYSTGETGRVGSPKRREIGHGALAEKALVPVLPSREEFPYAIRQVSEAIGSNGSTSMGSVCASTLSLLAAGVPLKAPVAGIAMGLVSGDVDGQHIYKTLTDILGAEDAFGDMDFKVAGTSEFITALQLDTKLDGIPADILASALQQAKEARTTILEVINECIDGPAEMSPYAPRIITTTVPVDKIGEVIGPKGKMINQIQEDTGAEIAIEDDGTVYISSEGGEAAEKAKEIIDQIANPHVPEAGETYNGKVVKTTSFGAFVNLTPGTDGLLHISQIRNLANGERIDAVEDVLKEGDTVEVVVQGVDDRGKISLAIPGFEDQESSAPRRDRGDRDDRRGGRGRRDDRRRSDDRDDRDYDDRPRRRRSDRDDDRDYDDRPRRRRSDRDDRDYDRDDRRSSRSDRDDRDYDDRPRRRRSDRDDRDYDRDDRRSDRRRGSRRDDRNPRYAADENYDEYRADREERSERPRRRVRRDFDPFED